MVIILNVLFGELYVNLSIFIILYSNKFSYVIFIENKIFIVELISWYFINEYKRGNIVMLRILVF